MALEPGLVVRVLGLKTLIRLKEDAGRERDRAVLPVPRRTLEEKLRREGRVRPIGPGSDPSRS